MVFDEIFRLGGAALAAGDDADLLAQRQRARHMVIAGDDQRRRQPAVVHDGLRVAEVLPRVERIGLRLDVRRRNVRFRPDSRQRLVFDNTGPEPYRGLFEVEPWVSWEYSRGRRGIETIRLLDEKERTVPLQPLPPEAAVMRLARLAFPLELPPQGRKILYLD